MHPSFANSQLLDHLPPAERKKFLQRKERIDRRLRQIHESIQQKCRQKLTELERQAEQEEKPELRIQEHLEAYEAELQQAAQEQTQHLQEELREWVEHLLPEVEMDGPTAELSPAQITPSQFEQQAQTPIDYLAGVERITRRGSKKRLKEQNGILLVQSAADSDELARADLLAVGMLRPAPTSEQMQRIIALANEYSERKIQTWLPLDEAGRQAMWKLVQTLLPNLFVHVPITSQTAGGKFRDKSPAELTPEERDLARQLILKRE